MKTDLEGLLQKGVIAQETYEWLKPLYDQETADLAEIQQAALERKNDPFYQHDSDDDDDDEDDFMTTTTTTLDGIEGTKTSISFVTDNNSSGHGNKVWHASIATCRYLKDHFLPKFISNNNNNCNPFRSLELGAGTAVPSFFLAQLLRDAKFPADNGATPKHVVRITDAKYYRNIMQILRSIERQDSPMDASLVVEVHPHNWGESIGFGRIPKDDNDDSASPHDLVIVSDCIYNPSYHDELLLSLSRTLKLPAQSSSGGVALVSFSLHGNVDDSAIWEFLESKLPSILRKDDHGKLWKLTATCVSCKGESTKEGTNAVVREGWHMETTMNELGMETEGIKPERWLAYVYEINWVAAD